MFFIFLFSLNFQTKAEPNFAYGSKKFFFHIEFTVKISFKSITSNSAIFSFLLILGDIDLKFFFQNIKLRVRYFFGMPWYILRGKKSKIERVTARSILAEMPHRHLKIQKLSLWNIILTF